MSQISTVQEVTDAKLDALYREIAEALEPRPNQPTWASEQSPLGCWCYGLTGWQPRQFARDLNACAVMRARLDAIGLAENFAAFLCRNLSAEDTGRAIFEVLNMSAEQQALAAREVLRGRPGQSDPLVADAERDVPDGDGVER